VASLLGFGRRCHLARVAALLASSLDFLQGTFEKIHFQSFLGQQTLQPMGLLSIRRFMGIRPWCSLSWLEVIELGLPLIEASSADSQLFR
jgi:hypothetical protein